ncbi:MAG TPA: helix-turn-helix domain-containing protein [Ktedonobacteraceae bacterium]|nr:helix-turn-helix domain-containing protein [Ktedonobacteraceae bacterium]
MLKGISVLHASVDGLFSPKARKSHSIPEICAALGISRATLYRYVKEQKSTA